MREELEVPCNDKDVEGITVKVSKSDFSVRRAMGCLCVYQTEAIREVLGWLTYIKSGLYLE